VDPALVDLAYARARPFFDEAPRKTALVVVGRGSSDPDANGDFCKMVRLLGEGRDPAWVVPGFTDITRPSFEEAIELLARACPARIVVLPYFLFAGRRIDVNGCVDAIRHVFPPVGCEREAGNKAEKRHGRQPCPPMPAASANAGATISRRAARETCRATGCP
jgi:hypothetical protein